MNDRVFAVDGYGNGLAKQIEEVDSTGFKLRTYKVKGIPNTEYYDDIDHELICKRDIITKEEYDTFGTTWIFEGFGVIPLGMEFYERVNNPL